MAFILRIIRMIIPLLFFFLVGKILKTFVAVYQYQQTRQNRGRGYTHSSYTGGRGGESNNRQNGSSSNPFSRDPYSILKCSRQSSNEEIKKSYRQLISKYHPDKFVGMELDDEFVKLASERFQQIQSAYDEIRRQRGF